MNKVSLFVFAMAFTCGLAGYAAGNNLQTEGYNFNAPVVPNPGSVSDKQTGMIIFDLSDNAFKGLDIAGNWNQMTTPGSSQVTSTGNRERLERLTIGTICTSDPCSITSQSGSWVTQVEWVTTGTYVVHIASGTFSAPPSCTIGTKDSGTLSYLYGISTTSEVYLATQLSTTTALVDGRFDLICVGPRP